MDDMREIVTLQQVEHLFLLLAIGGPILGALVGAILGIRRRRIGPGALAGFCVGLLGPLNLALWRMYNAITGRLGLDTVKNLLVNLALFLLLGIAAGLAAGILARRRAPGSDWGGDSAPVGAGAGGPGAGTDRAARRLQESSEPPRDH